MLALTWARGAVRALSLGAAAYGLTGFITPARAAEPALTMLAAGTTVREVERGLIVTPRSTALRRDGFAHTNHHVFVPFGEPLSSASPSGPGETPASLACIYGLAAATPGCPQAGTTLATGGARTIAIVDAYHYPTAAQYLQVFSTQYGLPAPKLKVIYASGKQPPQDSGWEEEEALDIEMAHGLAPDAAILLVEAASASDTDLLQAVRVAATAIGKAGGYVSMSWGGSEFPTQTLYQPNFTRAGIVMLAASGDDPGTEFPSVLPNVIAVGGTTIIRDGSGNYTGQSTWTKAGSGKSRYIGRPSFQTGVSTVVGTARGVPDISLEANPSSGVWAYSTSLKWFRVGGTSVATPLAAALLDVADSTSTKLPNSAGELAILYQNRTNADAFVDITAGSCGSGGGTKAKVGFDLCTGIGVPFGPGGK